MRDKIKQDLILVLLGVVYGCLLAGYIHLYGLAEALLITGLTIAGGLLLHRVIRRIVAWSIVKWPPK